MKPTLSQQVRNNVNISMWSAVMRSMDKNVQKSVSPDLDVETWENIRLPVLRNTHRNRIHITIIDNYNQ